MANAHLTDEEAIKKGISRAEFVRKGMSSRLFFSLTRRQAGHVFADLASMHSRNWSPV